MPQPSDAVSISPSAATDGDYRKKIKYGNRVQVSDFDSIEYPTQANTNN